MSNARFSILQAAAVKDKRISDSQFRTLAALGMYADEKGWCWPSLKTLAKDLSKSSQGVGRDTIALRKLGYLEVQNRYDAKTGGRHSNLYRLRFDLPNQHGDDTLSTSCVDTLSTPGVEVNDPSNDPSNEKNMAQKEKPAPSEITPIGDMPLDWQITHSEQPVTLPTEEQQWKADVDIAAMNIAKHGADLEPLAIAFMVSRRIIPAKSKIKGWAAAFREMKNANATPQHVTFAVQKLCNAELTVSDPWSILKTVINLANPINQEVIQPAVHNGGFYA